MLSSVRGPVALAFLCASAPSAFAETPSVVASIKPIHSLVASVMAGVGEPELLLQGNESPHTYALRPSDAAKLSEADVVFWVAPDIESFLGRGLDTLADGATVVELAQTQGLTLLPYREGGLFESHDHSEAEDHHDHDHGHDDHDHDHSHGTTDGHVWLDPANAQIIVQAIAQHLSEADPAHAQAYRTNAEETVRELAALSDEIAGDLDELAGRPFLVFHDAFQYFETAFDVSASGSMVISPEIAPGARRIAELQARIAETDTRCLIAEPQFPRELVDLLAGDDSRIAVLDPNGAAFEPGPGQYAQMMRANAQALAECLSDPA